MEPDKNSGKAMRKRSVVRGEGETRQRILDAAVRQFSLASYDEIGLREIAAGVGVDVAYVHRCFGSKEGLFLAVLEAIGKDVDFTVGQEGVAKFLASRLYAPNRSAGERDVDRLLVLIRSLASHKAGALAGKQLEEHAIEPLRAAIGDTTQFRAAMIMSMMIGLSIMRNLLQLPAVTGIGDEQAQFLVASAIDGILQSTVPASRENV